MSKTTLIIGASTNINRYSNIAIHRLRSKGVLTYAIGLRKGKVLDVIIENEKRPFKNIHTVTLYLNPKRQEEYYEYILSLKPKRVIFNPGTENLDFVELLQSNHIIAEVACTLVLLSINKY